MERKLAIEAEHEQVAKAISIDTAKEGLVNLLTNIEKAKGLLLSKKRVNSDNRELLLRRLDKFETRARSVQGYYEFSASQMAIGNPLKVAKDLVEELEDELQNELLLGIKGYHSRGKKVPHPKYALEIKELLTSGLKHLDKEIGAAEVGFEAPKNVPENIVVTDEIERTREALLEEELFPDLREITPDLPIVTAQDINEIMNQSVAAPMIERRAVPRVVGPGKAIETVNPKNFVVPVDGARADLLSRILSATRSRRSGDTLVPDNASPTLVPKEEEAVVVDEELSIFQDHEQVRGDGVFTGSILDRVEIDIEDLGERENPAKESVEDENTDIIAMESFEDSGIKIVGESATTLYMSEPVSGVKTKNGATRGPGEHPPHDEPTEDDVHLPAPETETAPHARNGRFDEEGTLVKKRGGGGGGGGPQEPGFWQRHWKKFAVAGAALVGSTVIGAEYAYLKKIADEQEASQNTDKPVLTIKDETVPNEDAKNPAAVAEAPAAEQAPIQPEPTGSIMFQEPAPRPFTIQDLLYSQPLPGAPKELVDTWEEVLAAQAEEEKPLFWDLPILKVDKTVWDAVETKLSATNPNVSEVEIIKETDETLKKMNGLSDNERLFGEKLKDGEFYEHVKAELLEAGGYDGVFEMVEGEAISVNGFLNAPEIAGNPALYGKMQRQFAAFLLTQSEIDKLVE